MSRGRKQRILLVEDDRSLGETLHERLGVEGYSVQWALTLRDARRAVEEFAPDLVVLDVRLPDGSGFSLAEELRARAESPPFLFLTAQADAPQRLQGFELGAEEFIPKPFHLRELLLRLEHVLDNHRHINRPRRLEFAGYTIDLDKYLVISPKGEEVRLARRECGLLELLIQERHRTVSRDEILDRLWGTEQFPSNRTVDNAIVKLRQALGPHGANAIQSIRGVGYRWVEEVSQALR